jgi:protein-L-isoaspartate(D-aspartate) O-methyltransferase
LTKGLLLLACPRYIHGAMRLLPRNSIAGDDVAAETARHRMVQDQIVRRGVTDPHVLEVMRAIPRHLFLSKAQRDVAYADSPQPIMCGQTISQPYIVASMTEYLQLRPGRRVLEIGTGCGYQTAVLAELASQVFTVECHRELCLEAQRVLGSLGYDNIHFRLGDGALGWPEVEPFDAIIVTAAASKIPTLLAQQLAIGGRMLIPIRQDPGGEQTLTLVCKDENGTQTEFLYRVRFVPLLHPGGDPY